MPVSWNCSAHDVQESKCIKGHLVYKVTVSGHLWLLHEVFFACTNPSVSWHPPKNLSAGTSHGFCSCPSICDLSTTTKWTRTSCECICCGDCIAATAVPTKTSREINRTQYMWDTSCEDPIERMYYTAKYPPICVYCASSMPEGNAAANHYPQCSGCSHKRSILQ